MGYPVVYRPGAINPRPAIPNSIPSFRPGIILPGGANIGERPFQPDPGFQRVRKPLPRPHRTAVRKKPNLPVPGPIKRWLPYTIIAGVIAENIVASTQPGGPATLVGTIADFNTPDGWTLQSYQDAPLPVPTPWQFVTHHDWVVDNTPPINVNPWGVTPHISTIHAIPTFVKKTDVGIPTNANAYRIYDSRARTATTQHLWSRAYWYLSDPAKAGTVTDVSQFLASGAAVPYAFPTEVPRFDPRIEPMAIPIGRVVVGTGTSPVPLISPSIEINLRPYSSSRSSRDPRARTRTRPRPNIRTTVSLSPNPRARPRVSVRPHNSPRRPPPRRTKERKLAGSKALMPALRIALQATEALDILDCMWSAMPRQYKMAQSRAGAKTQSAGYLSPQEKMKRIYRNFEHMNMQKFVECFIANFIEDALIGGLNKAAQEAAGLEITRKLPSLGGF